MSNQQLAREEKVSQYKWLAEKFGYYTECQLATLEHFEGRKSAPIGETLRHRQIADGMVSVCMSIGPMCVSSHTPRLRELLPL